MIWRWSWCCGKYDEAGSVWDGGGIRNGEWWSDGGCSGFLRGCADVDLWVCSARWKKFLVKLYYEFKNDWHVGSVDDLIACLVS